MTDIETRPEWHLATLERYRAFMDELIARFGGECNNCQSKENLEFDHVDWRTKDFAISTGWAMQDREKFELELLKCQLLCNPCHEQKTQVDKLAMGKSRFTHGTIYAWMKMKCACEVCTASKAKWNAERSEKRRKSEDDATGRGRYQTGPAEHGTYRRYKQGCKCDECRAANASKAAEQKAKKESDSVI